MRVTLLLGIVLLAWAYGCSPDDDPTRPYAQSADLSPAWSPAGDSIVFVHLRLDNDDPFSDGVYVISTSGRARRLVREGFSRSVDWSPDGRRIVIDSIDGLITCTPSGDSVQTILSSATYFPSWSPDGQTIAFDDAESVWLVPSQGGTPTAVTNGRDPDWAPDGTALVIRMGFPNAFGGELAIVTLSGDLIRRLTTDAQEDRSPAWSPDGSTVAWNRWPRDGGGRAHPEFAAVDTSGMASRLLLTGEGDLSWSPDGSQLVVSRVTNTGSKLFRIPASGGSAIQITF